MRPSNPLLWFLAAASMLVSACNYGPGTIDSAELQALLAAHTAEVSAPDPLAEQFAALLQCESGGNYQIVSSNGLYRGGYQFTFRTWDGVASRNGRPDLVGVDPAAASPADQDAMARALHAELGWKPWPGCTRKLGLS